MAATLRPGQPVGPTVYDRLDLTGVRLEAVLTGTRGRAAMLTTARERGYPARTVTPALTRFSRIYVIQVDADLDDGTVTLAARDGGTVTVALPAEFAYRKAAPDRLAALLAAVQADHPPQSLTAGLAECLAGVLDLCDRARRRSRTVPVEAIEDTLTVPLRPFLDAWTPPATTLSTTEEDI